MFSTAYQNLFLVLPGLGVACTIAFIFPFVKVWTGLSKGIQILFASFLILVAAQKGLLNSRILDLDHNILWLPVLRILAGDVHRQIVGQAVFSTQIITGSLDLLYQGLLLLLTRSKRADSIWV